MPRIHRTLALLITVLVAAVSLSGCRLLAVMTGGVPEDDFPDAFEQELAATLDASEIVVSHAVTVDYWKRPSNVPPREAGVVVRDDATAEDLAALIESLVQLSDSRTIPAFAFMDHSSLTESTWSLHVEGTLAAPDIPELARISMQTPWTLQHWDNNRIVASADAATADDARALWGAPESTWVRDRAHRVDIHVEEHTFAADWKGLGTAPAPELLEFARLLTERGLEIPSDARNFALEARAEDDGNGRQLIVEVSARTDAFRGIEPSDRPAVAEELGLTAMCDAVLETALEAIGHAPDVFSCRVNSTNLMP